jgi:hypothetical protein
MKLSVLSLSILLAPCAAFALDLQDGEYATVHDGAQGSLTIDGDFASIGMAAMGCSGSVKGPLTKSDDGSLVLTARDDGMVCEIEITESSSGLADLNSGPGCSYFSGASCGFSGVVTERTVSYTIEAIDAGFNSFNDEDRRAIQSSLKDADTYAGKIDGMTGQGTRLAIVEAAKKAFQDGATIDLKSSNGAKAFLAGLISTPAPVAAPTPQAADPETSNDVAASDVLFTGEWNCLADGMETEAKVFDNHFSITQEAIDWKEMGRKVNIAEASALDAANTNYRLQMSDDYIVHLFNLTASEMYLVAAGDAFYCQR